VNDLVRFEDRVKERLRDIVADLIPEDRFDQITSDAVRKFEREDIPKLVNAELTEKYRALIRAEFEKPEWQSRWNGVEQQASEMVQKLLVEAAPLVLASMLGGTMQNVLLNFQSQIQQMGRY
jgi:hypothetical protein